MVEIDSHTYQIKSMWGDERSTPSRFLITPGRAQNLELLRHLIANTHQAIVLCGPEGVGKTGLLGILQQRLHDEIRWCSVKGQSDLTFEEIHEYVGPLLRHQGFESADKHPENPHSQDFVKPVVLAIDNAGNTAPGFITRMIRFAENHPELHLLFVLTHDQWHLKNYTDSAIENCNLVEAKPLLQKECRDFIQHIASLTKSLRFGKGVTDEIVDAVYRNSHGIPARIIAHFPELNRPKEAIDPLIVLVIAVVCLVSIALYVQWFTASSPVGEKKGAGVQVSGRFAPFDFEQPIVSLPEGNLLKYAESSASADLHSAQREEDKKARQILADPWQETDAFPVVSSSSGNPWEASNSQGRLSAITEGAISESPSPDDDTQVALPPSPAQNPVENSESWLAAQPENEYALQLMVLSKETSIQAVIARHAELLPDLRVVRSLAKGKEKFVLLYGRFPDAASAENAKDALPAEFKSSLTRKFGAIRKDFPLAPALSSTASPH